MENQTNINLSRLLGQDAKYVGRNAAEALEGLPLAAWGALVEAVVDQNGAGSVPGIDCDVVKTHETLADFDSARVDAWSERGERAECSFAGFPARLYERFQTFKGQQRRTVIVVDCGDARAALCF